ncbi:MAG: V-type ATPase subunit [Lachnospiraceae bacterium]|nr:V-type ATPase subunit [Lachnospiraceae bacterium]MDD3616617.1 V-type ATPase subunit [Lachnospiraceae bacterium]
MGKLLSYSGLTTKLRAMQSKLINEEDFRTIAEMPNVTQAVAFLKTKPGYRDIWSQLDENDLHRGQIEKLLINSIYQSFTSVYRFADVTQRKFLDLYFNRYKSAIVKQCLTHIFDHRDVDFDVSMYRDFFRRHSKIDYDKLTASSTIEELVANLKGSCYYEPLARLSQIKEPTLFDYEMAIDLFVFKHIWDEKDKFLKGKELNEITKAYGSKFDMINLQWIYRSKKYYHMDTVDIYALLIPVRYKIKKPEIKALVESETLDEFEALLAKTYYGRHYEELKTTNLEDMYIEILRGVLERESRKDPYSVVSIYHYLYSKEHEIDRLTIALECIRYGISPNDTLSYIMKT